MRKGTRGRSPKTPAGSKRLTYEEIRDRFLAEPPANAQEELEYFVRLGIFVFGRWEAIADDSGGATPTNDDASPRWDECTQRDFDREAERARAIINAEVKRQGLRSAVEWMFQDPWGKILRGLGWCFMVAWEHFVGAIGLVLFALLLLLVFPHMVQELRSAIDEVLPHETRPPTEQQSVQKAPPITQPGNSG